MHWVNVQRTKSAPKGLVLLTTKPLIAEHEDLPLKMDLSNGNKRLIVEVGQIHLADFCADVPGPW